MQWTYFLVKRVWKIEFLGLEHVTKQFLHFGVSDDFFEKSLLNSMSISESQVGQKHQ